MKQRRMVFITFLLCLTAAAALYSRYGLPAFSSTRSGKIIVIDVGHGGNDPGKVSATGVEEKDVNLQIAMYLKEYLAAQDYTVYLTRETDCGLYDENVSKKKTSDLNNRIRFFKEKNAGFVVSIHQNSYPDTIQHGAQTFYFTGSETGKAFAETIQESLLQFDETNTRKAKASNTYYLLKHSSVPSVIVECGFLSNPDETMKLTDSNYQKELAYAIGIGICRFVR